MAIPKTDSSRRVIPIDPTVVGILKAHKERQDIERETLGDAWRDNDLVFPDTLGGELRTSNLERQRFGPMMAKAGVPRIRFHDMRHTAATLLLAGSPHLRGEPNAGPYQRGVHASCLRTHAAGDGARRGGCHQ